MKKFWSVVILTLFASHATADTWIFPPEIHKQEYTFGDVRIELVRDPSESRLWPLFELLIYNGGELQAKYRNVAFENIYASDNHQFFAGLSNSGVPGTAFVVFDSRGRLLTEVKHRYSSIEYISKSISIVRHWYKPDETSVRFVNPYGTIPTEVIVERKDMSDIDLLSKNTHTDK